MATFIVAWTAWLGVVVSMQAIYIFRVGVVVPFFISNAGIPRLPLKRRVLYGTIDITIAGVLLAIAVPAMFRRSVGIHLSDFANTALLGIPGVIMLAFPTYVVRMLKRTYPTLPTDAAGSLIIVRLCGGLALFVGMAFLAPW